MHIAYVLKRFPRLSETFILHELLALERLGHQLTVYAQGKPDEAATHPALAHLRADVSYVPKAPAAEVLGARGLTRQQWQAAWVAAQAQAAGIEHLHAHFATGATVLARDVHHLTGIPFSFTAHAKDIYHESVDFAFVRDAILDSAFTITVSDHNVGHLADACGPAVLSRVRRLYNGIDLRRFAFTGQAARLPAHILAVGRFVEKKGFLDLVDALARLRNDGHDAHLTLVGSGEEEAAIVARIAAHGLAEAVTLTGALTQDQVIGLMRTHTLMALPCVVGSDGNRDGLPTVLLEAMASGLPVVSTDVTGIPEMIHDGTSGRIVAQRSPRWLAGAIATLLASAHTRARFAVAARADVERRFDLDTNVATLAAGFAEASAARRGGVASPRHPRALRAGARA
jgi:glycosyltransferase involved in cell wall biosynthesis